MNKKSSQASFMLVALALLVSCDNHLHDMTYRSVSDGVIDKHEYIDLGLHSGTLWATCNVGAVNPEDYGDYFAWGENDNGKTKFNLGTYKFYCSDSIEFTKYNSNDKRTVLDSTDDAASTIWGGSWQMPKHDDWIELADSCVWEFTTLNGVNGYSVSKNQKNIFLPAAGIYNGSIIEMDDNGYYWSSKLCDQNNAVSFKGDSISNNSRFNGLSVRPVIHPAKNTQ